MYAALKWLPFTVFPRTDLLTPVVYLKVGKSTNHKDLVPVTKLWCRIFGQHNKIPFAGLHNLLPTQN